MIDNDTRTALANGVTGIIRNHPFYAEVRDEQKARAIAAVIVELISRLAQAFPPDARARMIGRVSSTLSTLSPAVFEGPSPPHPLWPTNEFALKAGQHFASMQGGKPVFLEMGTWNAWPDDRAKARIEADRLGGLHQDGHGYILPY